MLSIVEAVVRDSGATVQSVSAGGGPSLCCVAPDLNAAKVLVRRNSIAQDEPAQRYPFRAIPCPHGHPLRVRVSRSSMARTGTG